MSSRWWGIYALAVAAAVAPLWAGVHIPMVDLPQHLHLISVLHRLEDSLTIYPQMFELRGELTPYLGYYYLVDFLNWFVPELVANKIFLSAYVAGMALGLAFLLASLDRPVWPSLLALPFAYGDSFAWGFINYCAALPLVFLCLGLFVRAIADPRHRRAWSVGLAMTLVAVLLFHVQAFAYLGVALPFLLLTTAAPEDGATRGKPFAERLRAGWRPRLPALLGVVPGVALFLAWVVGRLGAPAEIAPGQPWRAWGPMLSAQNLSYKPFEQNRAEFVQVLANMLRDQSDRWAVYAVALVAAAGVLLALLAPDAREPARDGPIARFRLFALGLIALALFFALPFDIRGYMYYLNTRYAHLAAPLLLAGATAAAPTLKAKFAHLGVLAGLVAALVLAVPLCRGFAAFDEEAAALDELAPAAGRKPMVMGLIFNTTSRVVNHPVFLHAATVIAREDGGATNFSFASTPHSPLKYRGAPPPSFPSEWHPEQFDYATMGSAYDAFLIRGIPPERVFGARLESELVVSAQAGTFALVKRK